MLAHGNTASLKAPIAVSRAAWMRCFAAKFASWLIGSSLMSKTSDGIPGTRLARVFAIPEANGVTQTVGDFLLQRLGEWGVKRIYGYPGDGINGIMGALGAKSYLEALIKGDVDAIEMVKASAKQMWAKVRA